MLFQVNFDIIYIFSTEFLIINKIDNINYIKENLYKYYFVKKKLIT